MQAGFEPPILRWRYKDGTPNIEPDEKSHPFAKDGFEYRTVYFQDFDSKYYRITLSVGLADGIATVYNVGKIKRGGNAEVNSLKKRGSRLNSNSNTNVAQNATDVNTQSMQDGAQFVFEINEKQSLLRQGALSEKDTHALPIGSVSNTNVAQNATDVNTQSMQEGFEPCRLLRSLL